MDEKFGRYQLLSLIGQGGMGKVFKAHDTLIGRDVAVKVLSAELGAEPGYRQRFRREAHTAARLTEPHIIPIYDTGEIDGQLYLVMPVIDGIDVHGLLLRDGPMSPQRAVHVVEQLADALQAAHAVGLVHRDVKPSNALVTGNDHVYLIDFGLAHDTAATRLTRVGHIMGSWAYMAPERFEAGTADASGDIYALACVLYECLTGAKPYPGDSLQQQFTGHYSLDPPRPSDLSPTIPAGLDAVIARGMAKDPRQRYASGPELAADARRALGTAPRGRQETPPTATRSAHAPTRLHDRVPTPPPPATPDAAIPRQPRRLPPVSQARPADRPLTRNEPPPQPTGGRRRRRLTGPLIAAAVVVVAVAAITGYLLRPSSPGSQSPGARPAPGSAPIAQPASDVGQSVLPFTGLSGPDGIAADTLGDVFVTDSGNNRVLELAAGAGGPTELPFAGLGDPSGVTVDAARTVYVTNAANNRVLKLPAGSTSTIELPLTGLNGPHGVAVDAAGDLYIAAGNTVLKLPAGSSSAVELPFTGLSGPTGVAVDSSGTVYITDTGNNRVLKLSAGAVQVVPFTGLNKPDGIGIDTAGDVFVADAGNNRVLKLPAGSTTQTALVPNGLNDPRGVVADPAGNVYVTDTGNNRVLKFTAG